MRPLTISTFKTGMTRLAPKAGASAQSLHDLVNGQMNAAGNPEARDGTRVRHVLPPGTIGLVVFGGRRHVFSSGYVAGVELPYVVNAIPHPKDRTIPLVDVHFAEPLMGELYIAAEYADGTIWNFYLTGGPEGGQVWEPGKVYLPGDSVRPTLPNGLVYVPKRLGQPGQLWRAGAERAVGDVVEPTVFNGFRYVATEVHGTPPRSGQTEPLWVAEVGGVVVEEADATPTSGGGQDTPPPTTPPRYQNSGSGGGGGGAGGNDLSNQVIQ